eukprot:COSAG06_NODE_3150_length_5768_cov_7.694733_2_plen_95_part_00
MSLLRRQQPLASLLRRRMRHPLTRSHTETHSPCGASHALRGGDLVGFVDLTEPSTPRMISAVPFVSKEPTGMLIVNDALIVVSENGLFGPFIYI